MIIARPPRQTQQHEPLRVVQSFGEPGRTTNPYLTQLFASVPGVAQRPFSWRTALFARYDVFHLHLPDVLFLRESRIRSLGGAALFLALLVRLRLTRTALVRTAHNVAPHEERGALTTALDRLSARWTSLWIRLNEHTPVPEGAAAETILIGDYVDWFSRFHTPEARRSAVLFFGLIRPYKGVGALISAFRGLEDLDASLRVVGRSTAELATELTMAAEGDERIALVFDYVDDEQLAREIGGAELIVLPYRDMHNSSVAILALSLDRPILIPDNPSSADLAAEVGPEWVQLFSGTLDTEDIERALAAVGSMTSTAPDLSRRRWSIIGAEHARAYARAVRIRRGD